MNIIDTDKKYIANTYARFPIAIVSGNGSTVYDDKGKEYIDLASGIATNPFGYNDEVWKNAVKTQMGKVQHISNLYYTAPDAKLAELLCEKTGMSKVFFSNSGAEANECAIKAARRYSYQKYGKGRHTIVTLKNSFHGRTMATLAATGQDALHPEDFMPYPSGFVYAEDLDDVKRLVNEHQCAAIMFELVQGEGGVNTLSKSFVGTLVALAEEKDILLIVDEVQTGNGRTGSLYAYMQYGFVPDIFTTAKGLGGGLPIGATVFSKKTADVYTPGTHGSTFGGNPLSCAGALSVIERLDDNFLSEVQKKADYIKNQLLDINGVKSISGMGLMIGIEIEKDAKDVINECMNKGVLVISAKEKVRLLPPLNIPQSKLEAAINILKEVISNETSA